MIRKSHTYFFIVKKINFVRNILGNQENVIEKIVHYSKNFSLCQKCFKISEVKLLTGVKEQTFITSIYFTNWSNIERVILKYPLTPATFFPNLFESHVHLHLKYFEYCL